MKVVIKVGTQSILSDDGTPFEPVLKDFVEQIATLQQNEHQIVLVSSEAVGSGRKVARQILGREYGNSIAEKQVLASLGQHELMHVYATMFKKHTILSSQIVLTKQDFQTRRHYLNISSVFREILECKNIIPIVNENDSVAVAKLMFTDNDELAGLIAAQIGANKLIILTNVEGVYTGHPDDPDAKLVEVINPMNGWPKISNVKSIHGRGGMISKIGTARNVSGLGITTHIANINQPNVVTRIVNGESIGTTILPSRNKSSIKRWIAYSTDQRNGAIVVNNCLYEILKENRQVISVLPIGIQNCTGTFKKGDLVDIIAPGGKTIGVGVARYESTKLQKFCNEKNQPVFIHYDYLHIF